MVIFILVLVMSFTVPLCLVENVDNGESNSQGVALAENCLPSASKTGAKGIQVQFDAQVKSEESIIKIEPAQTKKGSSESLNLIAPKEAEAKKPVTGLLKTTLDITPENDALKLDFSLQNIAEQDLSYPSVPVRNSIS